MDWESCLQELTYKQVGDEALKTKIPTLACFGVVFERIVFFAFYFAGIITVLLVITAGVKFIISGGDAKQIDEARKTMTYAIIGLAVVLFSFAIIQLVSAVTGVDCILEFGFSNCS